MKTILTFSILIFLYSFSFGQNKSEMVFKKVERSDSIALHETFVELIAAIEHKKLEKVKLVSLASIDCIFCISSNYKNGPPKDYMVPIDTFYNQALIDFVGSPLYKAIKTRGYKAYLQIIKITSQRIYQSVIQKICIYMSFGFKPINLMNGQIGMKDKVMLSNS